MKVNIGDIFKTHRFLEGYKTHKCMKISETEGFNGWIIDQFGAMINPETVVEIVRPPKFQWVKYQGEWEVAQVMFNQDGELSCYLRCGCENTYETESFDEIGCGIPFSTDYMSLHFANLKDIEL